MKALLVYVRVMAIFSHVSLGLIPRLVPYEYVLTKGQRKMIIILPLQDINAPR